MILHSVPPPRVPVFPLSTHLVCCCLRLADADTHKHARNVERSVKKEVDSEIGFRVSFLIELLKALQSHNHRTSSTGFYEAFELRRPSQGVHFPQVLQIRGLEVN